MNCTAHMDSEALGPVDSNERIEISVIVRPRHELNDLESEQNQPMSREQFAAKYGADPADLQRVEKFAKEYNLAVVESSCARRTIRLEGRAADISAAFG